MIMMIAGLKISLGIPYRQLDGLLKHMMLGRKTPHYSTIQKRIAKLDVNIDNNVVTFADKTKKIMLAVDATGIKEHNGGVSVQVSYKGP